MHRRWIWWSQTTRGAGPDAVPDTAGFGVTPTLLVCDAIQAESWSAGVDGATHCLVAPFSAEALRLQLALLFANTRQSADDLPSLQEQLANLAQTGSGGLHAMLIGLRRMAAINATYGPLVGDAALEAVGDRIARHVARHSGADAFTARLSGGDFLIAHVMPEERVGWQVVAEQLLRRRLPATGCRWAPSAVDGARIAGACQPDEDPVSLLDRLSTGLAMARESPAEPVRWADRQSDHAPHERLPAGAGDRPRHRARRNHRAVPAAVLGANGPGHRGRGAGPLAAPAAWRNRCRNAVCDGRQGGFHPALSRHIRERALGRRQRGPGRWLRLRLSLNVTAEDLGESGYARREIGMIAASGFEANG